MVYVPATVKGGLPMIADVWFSGPDYFGECDSGCDGLYWAKSDGSRGKRISDTLMANIEKRDPYWESDIVEQANEWLSYECRDDKHELTEWFLLLNPRK